MVEIEIDDLIAQVKNPELEIGEALATQIRLFADRDHASENGDGVRKTIEVFCKETATARKNLDFAGLQAALARLWQREHDLRIPDQLRNAAVLNAHALKAHLYRRAATEAGWTSTEVDGALALASDRPGAIGDFSWNSVVIDGYVHLRTDVRAATRTAAYSDEGWRKHAEVHFPKIERP